MYNIESISLKIIKILYQLSKHNNNSKADIELIENRFSFIDQAKGLEVITQSIKSLNNLGFIEIYKEKQKILYKITEKGKKFYNQFKYLIDSPSNPSNIIIQGNWTGNNHNYNINNHNKTSSEIFPGESIEFMDHYTDIISELDKVNSLIYKEKKSEDIKEHLENIKSIINSNIEKTQEKYPIISKLEKLSSQIEKQIYALNKKLSKQFSL